MPSPLVRTKLYVPQVRRGLVARPRLSERLNRTPPPRLTLISAPPGFGKTTLLAAWLDAATAADHPVAWVSLEETEQRADAFWTYVVTALDTAAPGVGAGALPLLQTANPPIDTVLATVLNELSALPGGLSLVLDDYHLADGTAIAADMTFLLEHLPQQVQLVISTRADPALPLARLRARGELVEVRAADLRFTRDEVAAYLNEVVGLDLDTADVAALEGRTEGWIAAAAAGRALAPGSRRRRPASSPASPGTTGTSSTTWSRRCWPASPTPYGASCSQTSILDRLSGPLCDAVTGGDDGKAVLELLDRSNLFVVPLDDHRQLVPLPPPLRRRPAHASARGAARGARRPAPPRRASGTTRPGRRFLRSGTRSRPVTSSGRPSWSSWRSRISAGTGRRPRSGAGSTTSRPRWCASGRCWPWASSGR